MITLIVYLLPHPTHSHTHSQFLQGWIESTRVRIETFLEEYLDVVGTEALYKTIPALYTMYADSGINSDNRDSDGRSIVRQLNDTPSGHGHESLIGNVNSTGLACGHDIEGLPSDVIAIFKNREEKLVRFSQAIIDITSDLLGAIENGDTLDHSFLTNFKEKFDFFRGALPVIEPHENDVKTRTLPPPLDMTKREDDHGSTIPINSSSCKIRLMNKHTKTPLHSAHKTKRKKRIKEVDIHSLKFEEIVADLYSKVHEVENFLIESSEPELQIPVVDVLDPILVPKVETKLKYAVSAAMTGSSLACTLAHMIVRPDKEDQSLISREDAVNVLVKCDILGMVKRNRRRASLERMEPDTSNWKKLMKTSMRNEGVVGFIDALKCYIPVQTAKASAIGHRKSMSSIKLPSFSTLNREEGGICLAGGISSFDKDSMEGSGAQLGSLGSISTISLLEASQCLCESLYRLVVAIGSTGNGRQYLHTYGTELTSHTTKLLILLPSSFNYQDAKNSTGAFSDGSSLSAVESANGSLSERRAASQDLLQDSNPASSLRLWCILALTVLAAQFQGSTDKDTEKDSYVSEEVRRAVESIVGTKATQEGNTDCLQLLIVEDGALEWLNEAFFSLLMEILAAAFSGNAKVLQTAAGNDSLAIGMAALSLDARQQSAKMSNFPSAGRVNRPHKGLGSGVGGDVHPRVARRSSSSAVPQSFGRFSISCAESDTVPQELLILLDLCLGMLLFAARSHRVQAILTSTAAFQEISKSLLKTLFRLLLVPQLTQALAESILVILNVLLRDEVKIRILAKELKEVTVIERKVSLGGLKWFLDPTPLEKLLILINSDVTNNNVGWGVDDDNAVSKRASFNVNGGVEIEGSNSTCVGNTKSNEAESDFVVTSLAEVALSKVMVTQTFATDNTQLLDFLSRQRSFTGKVNTNILACYEDPLKAALNSPHLNSKVSSEDHSQNGSRSRQRRSHHIGSHSNHNVNHNVNENVNCEMEQDVPVPSVFITVTPRKGSLVLQPMNCTASLRNSE